MKTKRKKVWELPKLLLFLAIFAFIIASAAMFATADELTEAVGSSIEASELEESSAEENLGEIITVATPAQTPVPYAIGDYPNHDIINGFEIWYDYPTVPLPNVPAGVVAHYDYLPAFYLKYTGPDQGQLTLDFIELDLGIWEVYSQVATELEIDLATDISSFDLTRGSYTFWFESKLLDLSSRTSIMIQVNFDSISSKINSHAPINPPAFVGNSLYAHTDNLVNSGSIIQEWRVTYPDGTTQNYSTAQFVTIFNYDLSNPAHLPEGDYSVELLGAGSTVNGTTVPDDYIFSDTSVFTVRYPFSTITVDLPVNPTSITGTQKIPASSLNWEIFDDNGAQVLFGSGDTIPPVDFSELPPGHYDVQFVEDSPEGLHHISKGIFEMRALSRIETEYYLEDAGGTQTNAGTWPADIVDVPGTSKTVSGMPIPAGYELITLSVNGTAIAPTPANNQHTLNMPLANQTTTLKFIYKQSPAPILGRLVINHVFHDENGNTIAHPSSVVDVSVAAVGTAYNTSKLPNIPNGFYLSAKPTNANGSYINGTITVNYIYKPIPKNQGSVIVEHIITLDDGSEILYQEDLPIIDVQGNPYTTTPININGFSANTPPANASGNITPTPIKVTYKYKGDPSKAVVVELHIFLDETGKEVGYLQNSVTTYTGANGSSYSTSKKNPVGYTLVNLPANASGIFVTGTQALVKYFYKPTSPIVNPPLTGGGSSGSGGNGWFSPDGPSTSTVSLADINYNPTTGGGSVLNITLVLAIISLLSAIIVAHRKKI